MKRVSANQIIFSAFTEVPLDNLPLTDVNTNLIHILQRVLDSIVAAFENNDVEPPHQVILLKMFQCLELLYSNIALSPEQATQVHNWLYGYCKEHEIKGVENNIVHKLLFTQRVRTQKGPIFEGIAKQIETVVGQIQEVTKRKIHLFTNIGCKIIGMIELYYLYM